MNIKKLIQWSVMVSIVLTLAIPALAGDPSGADTYTDDIAGLKIAVNFTWTLIAAFLVFFMQAGFVFLGAGALRVKNTVNYFTKSYMDFSIGAIAYWAVGFALMYGGSQMFPGLEHGNSWIGYSGFFLIGDAYDVQTIMFWMFQVVFAATAATIVAGVLAERLKLQAYLIYSAILTAVIYSIYGHWIWGGGWLSTLPFGAGAKDFAGSGAVHAIGGIIIMVGMWFNEWKLKIDDPIGAVPCHGYNGLWGLIAVGIFADGTYGGVSGLIVGETGQLVAQVIDAATVAIWALATGFIMFGILKYTVGIRVSADEELSGLDVQEHGTSAYPEFQGSGPRNGVKL